MLLRSIILVLLVAVTATAHAQSRKTKRKRGTKTEQPQPTTLNPLPQKEYAPKASKKNTKGPTYESEQQFYERMAKLEKTRRKNEKYMDKPQYSDPSYFGHKRPPKKRKAGKLKFCKECGIRH